jgi:hypothetical protein
MRQDIRVLPMAPGEYAAEVDEGDQTTHHRVVLSEDLIDTLDVPNADEQVIVEQTLRCLLDREPNTALPHDIDFGRLDTSDTALLDEIRARVVG